MPDDNNDKSRRRKRIPTKRLARKLRGNVASNRIKDKPAKAAKAGLHTVPDPPMPFAIGSFGTASMATVSVKVDYDSQRHDYALYASQTDPSPAGKAAAKLATTENHPAHGEFGSVMHYDEGVPLYVALQYFRGGDPTPTTRTVAYLATEVVEGTELKKGLN